MDDQTDKSTDGLSINDATMDDAVPAGTGSGLSMESSLEASSLLERSRIALIEQSRIALVALVDGTLAQLDADTQALLRTRLRLSAWVLFFGFAAFLVKHVFQLAFTHEFGISFIGFHAAVTAVLGLVGLLITYRRTVSLVRLRLAELLIFGLPLVFFLAVTFFKRRRTASGPMGKWVFSASGTARG